MHFVKHNDLTANISLKRAATRITSQNLPFTYGNIHVTQACIHTNHFPSIHLR